jgi:hypothetical protein
MSEGSFYGLRPRARLGVWPSLFHRVASRSILRSHSSNAVGFGCSPGRRQRYCHQIKRLRASLRRKTSQPTSLRVELGIPQIKCLRLPRKCALEIRLSFRGYTPRVGAFIEGDGAYCFPCFVGQFRYLRGHFSQPAQVLYRNLTLNVEIPRTVPTTARSHAVVTPGGCVCPDKNSPCCRPFPNDSRPLSIPSRHSEWQLAPAADSSSAA